MRRESGKRRSASIMAEFDKGLPTSLIFYFCSQGFHPPPQWKPNRRLAQAQANRRAVRAEEENERQAGDDLGADSRSEEHTSELQSLRHLVCRLLLEKKKKIKWENNKQIS